MKKIILLFTICIYSCSEYSLEVNKALEMSGDNKEELIKVLDYYKNQDNHKKLKAAEFLIGNMLGKSYRNNSPFLNAFLIKLDSLRSLQTEIKEKDLKFIWKKCESQNYNKSSERKFDVRTVTAKLLIDNIDETFLIWEKVSWSSAFTFEQFCEYVLPYRNVHGTPTIWRKGIREKYDWALENGSKKDILQTVNQINDSIHWFKYFYKMNTVPEMSISDLYRVRYGSCRHHSSLKIGVLRSLGIPAAQVFALTGTQWVSVLNEDEKSIDYGSHYSPTIGEYYQEKRKRFWPKVFMYTYKNNPNPFGNIPINDIPPFFRNTNIKDVSNQHITTDTAIVNLTISPPKKTKHVFLNIFYDQKWVVTDWAKIDENTAIFNQMGVNNIYFPSYYIEGEYYPAGKPFYLKKDGAIKLFDNKLKAYEKIKLTRKFPLNVPERKYSNLMVGSRFEGANNPSFKNANLLASIKKTPQIMEELVVSTNKKFRYVRYLSDTLVGVAEVRFIGKEGKPLKGKVIHNENIKKEEALNAFDFNIRSNCNNDNDMVWEDHDNALDKTKLKDYNTYLGSWIGLDLGEPKKVGAVKYLFRNSFNSIELGDEYELFYWDDTWKSLGKKIADQNYLWYDVPINTVFLLKNNSRGKQELPFFIEEDKVMFGSWMD